MTRTVKSPDTKTFTPLAAAKHAGCGRTTIMKAIKEHDLRATRDNRNRWKIDAEVLEKWMESRPVTVASVTDSDDDTDASVASSDAMLILTREHAAAEATILELRSQLAKNDDRNAEEIRRLERIIDRLTAPKPTLLQRIFGPSSRQLKG